MNLEPGAALDHFRIVSFIGRGGMADVYLAEDTRLAREVALKVLPPEFATDEARALRFQREVRAAASLSHPGIVPVHHVGEADGLHYYAMALVPGGDLKARIRAHPGGMAPAEALAVAAAVARALGAAHGRGIVHRDVKPENVLFTADGVPQLTDFGIARAVGTETRMTAAGTSIGTPHYMSPEQALGNAVDARSDLYSLGVVLYELLMGVVPYDSDSAISVAVSHINEPVPVLRESLATYQPLLDRLLAKSPSQRYATGAEVAAACDALARGGALPVAPARTSGSLDSRSSEEPRTEVVEVPFPEGVQDSGPAVGEAPSSNDDEIPRPAVAEERLAADDEESRSEVLEAPLPGVADDLRPGAVEVAPAEDGGEPPSAVDEEPLPDAADAAQLDEDEDSLPEDDEDLPSEGGEDASLAVGGESSPEEEPLPEDEASQRSEDDRADRTAHRPTQVRRAAGLGLETAGSRDSIGAERSSREHLTTGKQDARAEGAPPSATRSWGRLAGMAALCIVVMAGGLYLWSTLTEEAEPAPETETEASPRQPSSPFVVEVSPAEAEVELVGADEEYSPGVRLTPGEYIVSVGAAGYETHNEIVVHGPGPTLHGVKLERVERRTPQAGRGQPSRPSLSPFVVEVSPAEAQVELVGAGEEYLPGMRLPPGEYIVSVSAAGYETHNEVVMHGAGATLHPVRLERTPEPDIDQPMDPSPTSFLVEVSPPEARVELVDAGKEYAPGMELAPGGYRIRVSAAGYVTHEEFVEHGTAPTSHAVALARVSEVDGPSLAGAASDEPAPIPVVQEAAAAGVVEGPDDERVEPSEASSPPDPTGPVYVTGDVVGPVKIHEVRPQYTAIARRAGVEGAVILQVEIDREGNVADVTVLKPLRMGLSNAAAEAVKKWKYRPATLNGKPIAVYLNVSVQFTL